jgi:type II secretory pathway pseudopilin PulG
MMITLMLAVALITIGLLAVLPALKQQVQRDQEDELRHRGTAYMRAIQHFYKKFGRYPASIAELENTNNIRFLRKHYTDPMSRDPKTGKEKDFKLLHQQDIALNNGPVLPGQPGQSGPGGQSGLAGSAPGGFGASSGAQTGPVQPSGAAGGDQTPASGDSGNSSSPGSGASGNSNSPGSPSNANSPNSGSGLSGQTFGGGPILGVSSTNSKTKSVRVFFDKTHYSDWLFIYVTQLDRGGLLVGPVNPNMPPAANLNGLTPPGVGQPGMGGPGMGGPGFGGPGQGPGQGLMPNSGQSQPPQPQQNSGQTPPQQ